jgi:hypothetical protein
MVARGSHSGTEQGRERGLGDQPSTRRSHSTWKKHRTTKGTKGTKENPGVAAFDRAADAHPARECRWHLEYVKLFVIFVSFVVKLPFLVQ